MENNKIDSTTKKRDHSNGRGKVFRALRSKTRAVTKAPRLLGTRVKHLLRDELYIDVSLRNAPTVVTKEIASLELLAAYHRWLRGVQAFLAIVVFILSLMESDTVVNWTIFGVSEATVLIIIKIYGIKAEYTGLTNMLYADHRNVLTSPFLWQMLLEILIWNILTPPIILFWRPFFELINYFMFIRLYAVVVYIHNAAYVYRSFCRAMAAVVALPLRISFTVRTALVFRKVKFAFLAILLSWISISCMYSKAENISLREGLWYAFQTISTIGYGDISPNTAAGRLVTVLAWCVSFLLISYIIVVFHASLTEDVNEYNMYILMRCHKLSHAVRQDSAKVIQSAWRFYHAKRQLTPTILQKAKTLLLSWSLTSSITTLRQTRIAWVDATRRFRNNNNNISPTTGFSEFQDFAKLQHAQRVARHAQRQIDVDIFVSKFTKQRENMPSREEVEKAIYEHTSSSNSPTTAGYHSDHFNNSYTNNMPAAEDTAKLVKKVEVLEGLCGRLAAMIESLSVAASTNPPSLAQSHF